MDKSETIEIVEMLRTLIHNLDIRPIWESSHIENVKPSSTAFVLSKAINAIEYLNGELEDCEEADYWEDLAKKIADQNGCDITNCYPKTLINNPANFCGNCKHYAQMGKDNDTYEGICTQHYIKRVDPDDASCEHFKSNQVDRDKPDQPCCKVCDREDCSNCTLCPF